MAGGLKKEEAAAYMRAARNPGKRIRKDRSFNSIITSENEEDERTKKKKNCELEIFAFCPFAFLFFLRFAFCF